MCAPHYRAYGSSYASSSGAFSTILSRLRQSRLQNAAEVCTQKPRNQRIRSGYSLIYGARYRCTWRKGRQASRRACILHRSEPRCSKLNDETILKREFMRISACEFRLTRVSQSINWKCQKGLQIREVRRFFPTNQVILRSGRAQKAEQGEGQQEWVAFTSVRRTRIGVCNRG